MRRNGFTFKLAAITRVGDRFARQAVGGTAGGGAPRAPNGVGSVRGSCQGGAERAQKALSMKSAPTLLLLAVTTLLVATCSPGESVAVPKRLPSVIVLEPNPEEDQKLYTSVLANLYDEWERFQALGKEWPVGNRIMSVNDGTIDPIPEAIISLFDNGTKIMSPEDALREVLKVGASHGTEYYSDQNAMFEHVKEVLDFRWDAYFADGDPLADGQCPGGQVVGHESKGRIKWIGEVNRIDVRGDSSHGSSGLAYKSLNNEVRVYEGALLVFEGVGSPRSSKCDYDKVDTKSDNDPQIQ